eukprot:m.46938 g.46938  ORF g.46938 m.46938 type:complete len:960 (+) comp13184_c0_seq1:178-3057(+)
MSVVQQLAAAEARCKEAHTLLQEKDATIHQLKQELTSNQALSRSVPSWFADTQASHYSSDVVSELLTKIERQSEELSLLQAAQASWQELQPLTAQIRQEAAATKASLDATQLKLDAQTTACEQARTELHAKVEVCHRLELEREEQRKTINDLEMKNHQLGAQLQVQSKQATDQLAQSTMQLQQLQQTAVAQVAKLQSRLQTQAAEHQHAIAQCHKVIAEFEARQSANMIASSTQTESNVMTDQGWQQYLKKLTQSCLQRVHEHGQQLSQHIPILSDSRTQTTATLQRERDQLKRQLERHSFRKDAQLKERVLLVGDQLQRITATVGSKKQGTTAQRQPFTGASEELAKLLKTVKASLKQCVQDTRTNSILPSTFLEALQRRVLDQVKLPSQPDVDVTPAAQATAVVNEAVVQGYADMITYLVEALTKREHASMQVELANKAALDGVIQLVSTLHQALAHALSVPLGLEQHDGSGLPLPLQQALYTVYKGVSLIYLDLKADLQSLASAMSPSESSEPTTIFDESLESGSTTQTLQSILSALQENLADLRSDVQRASTTAVATQTSPWQPKAQPCSRCPELVTAAAQADQTIASLQYQLDTCQEATKKVQQRLNNKADLATQYKAKLETMESELHACKLEKEKQASSLNALRRKQQLQQAKLESAVRETEGHVADAEHLAKLQNEVDLAHRKQQALLLKRREMEREAKVAAADVESLKEELGRVRRQQKQSNHDCKTANLQVTNKQQQIEDLEEQITGLKSELDGLENKYSDKVRELAGAQQQQSRLQQQYSELLMKYDDLSSHLLQLEQQQQQQHHHLEQQQQHYHLEQQQHLEEHDSYRHHPRLERPRPQPRVFPDHKEPTALRMSIRSQSLVESHHPRMASDLDDNCSELTMNLLQPLASMPLDMTMLTSLNNSSRPKPTSELPVAQDQTTNVSQHVRDLLGLGDDQVNELMSSLYDA